MPSAALRQLGLQQADDAVLLGGGGFPLPRRVREVREHGRRPPVAAVPGEHLDPGRRPGRGVAEVQGPPLRGRPRIRLRHRDRARFQLERRGDAVEGLEPVPAHALRVAVQVDEAGRDHAALGPEHGAPAQIRTDGGDHAVLDGDVQRRVDALSGIDHTPAADHHGELAVHLPAALAHCHGLPSGRQILSSRHEAVKAAPAAARAVWYDRARTQRRMPWPTTW